MPALPTVPTVAVFDCDGVMLQSNRLKSDAFARVLHAEGHAPDKVDEFVAWHRATGGVSRFAKFARFYREILALDDWQARTDAACTAFGDDVGKALRQCPTIPGLETLLAKLGERGVPLSVNTGGAQTEIRAVLKDRGLARQFETILGSPTTKRDNMLTLRDMELIAPGGIYLGDSELDYELASEFGLHFVYVAYESEWNEGDAVTRAAGGTVVADLTHLAF